MMRHAVTRVRIRFYQHGAVLFFVLIMLGGLSTAFLVHNIREPVAGTGIPGATGHELREARLALLAYATSYADNYRPTGAGVGHLPCPDLDPVDDGNPDNDGPNPPCRQPARQLGRLPRQTFTYASPQAAYDGPNRPKRLSFHSRRSTLDQQLWYAVSSAFVNNPVSTVVNPDTPGTLTVDQQSDVVAVIIAPGDALPTQVRQRPGDRISAYLEGENADGDRDFTRRHHSALNDRLAFITRQELLPVLERRVLGFVGEWFADYQQRLCPESLQCYPYAATGSVCVSGLLEGDLPLHAGDCDSALAPDDQLDGVPINAHWFLRNRWQQYIRYTIAPECIDPTDIECTLRVQTGSETGLRYSQVSVAPGAS